MLCCWVSNGRDDKEGKCILIYKEKAKAMNITGDFTFDGKEDIYWNCGNKSIYLNVNIILFLISLLLLLIF